MKLRWLLTLFLWTLLACSPKPQISPTTQALSNTAHQLIVPWHQQFAVQTQSLYDHLERFCQNPGNAGELEASRSAWNNAMLAWQQLRIIQFGPVTDGNLAWKVQFWPDSHNRVGRKVDQLINEDKPITSASLAQNVVLVQGLSAIEYLLFDPQKDALSTFKNPKACELALAASDNTAALAKTLLERWQPDGKNYLGTFLSAGPNNPEFSSEAHVVAALLSGIVSNLEVIKNKKIGDAFGGAPERGKVNPYKLELWRSGLSLQALQSEIDASTQLYVYAIKPLLEEKNQNDLSNIVESRLRNIAIKLASQKAPLFETLRDTHTHQEWQAVWQDLSALLSQFKREVASQLDVQLGFNANDGD